MEILPLTGGERPVMDVLLERVQAAAVVPLLADRDFSRAASRSTFFGRRTRMPAGPAILALRTGAPLYTVRYVVRGPRRGRPRLRAAADAGSDRRDADRACGSADPDRSRTSSPQGSGAGRRTGTCSRRCSCPTRRQRRSVRVRRPDAHRDRLAVLVRHPRWRPEPRPRSRPDADRPGPLRQRAGTGERRHRRAAVLDAGRPCGSGAGTTARSPGCRSARSPPLGYGGGWRPAIST